MRVAVLKRKTAEKVATKKVVLAGNPNAGKTTLFNALTKSNLRTGNFHGVTTSPAKKNARRRNLRGRSGDVRLPPVLYGRAVCH